MKALTVAVLALTGIGPGLSIAATQSQQSAGSRFAERLKSSNGWQQTVREPLPPPQEGRDRMLRDARERWADRVLGVGMPLEELYDRKIGGRRAEPEPSRHGTVPVVPDRVVVVARFTGYEFVLTKSHFALFTEMYLSVERVLESASASIGIGTRLTAITIGGTVRLPSGRVLQRATGPRPFMPVPGHRYLLYLRYAADGDFYLIVKSVELAGGRALPNSPEDVENAENGTWPFLDQDEETVLSEVEGTLR
jgi:hypothetical protein